VQRRPMTGVMPRASSSRRSALPSRQTVTKRAAGTREVPLAVDDAVRVGDPLPVRAGRVRNRAPGERVVATLKTWRLLTKLRCCPHRATAIIAANR
jgi:hypothetical protein